MEGTQPSTAGGDGAPTAMVAVPGLSGALTQGYTFLGGSGTVSMEASLRLRAKDYAAHDRWLVKLSFVGASVLCACAAVHLGSCLHLAHTVCWM